MRPEAARQNWKDWRNILDGEIQRDREVLERASERHYRSFVQPTADEGQVLVLEYPDQSSLMVKYSKTSEGFEYSWMGVTSPDLSCNQPVETI